VDTERVFVGLGANLGNARATVGWALQALRQLPGTRVVAASSLYRSAPVQASGPDFINAVAELRTGLEPGALLAALQSLEQQQGRERPFRNAPRTLDLDLLLHGERVLQDPSLTLPHPRLHERAFVLLPLLELAPALVHPLLGPLQVCVAATADQPIERLP
jgi:2-amino-4-hydroxy-6-hydroxymethyldihydropteridine diphosphokinase